MKAPAPSQGAGGNGVLKSGVVNAPPTTVCPAPQQFDHLDDLTRADLVDLWWRLRRYGVRLPAELDVIVIQGSKS